MRVIVLNNDNIIDCVKNILEGYELQPNEYFSDKGLMGQKMLEDGTFVDVPKEPETPQPTLEDQIKDIKNTVDLLLLKQEGLI